MQINPSIGNFFNKIGNTVPASNPSSGEQEKPSAGPGEVKSDAKASPQTVEIKPVDNQKGKISNQVANPSSEGVDITA
tara:strand:- start:3061 stop:3294 length:234 start_codon:yes stop_codon:yes gene_type:complete